MSGIAFCAAHGNITLGHIRRASLLIHRVRRLLPNIPLQFLTDLDAGKFSFNNDVDTHYFEPLQDNNRSDEQIQDKKRQLLKWFMQTRPEVIVVDSDLFGRYDILKPIMFLPNLKRVLIVPWLWPNERFGTDDQQSASEIVCKYLDHYDLVIVAQHGRVEWPYSCNVPTKHVGVILESRTFPSVTTIRRSLGLPEDKFVVYGSVGGGGIEGMQSLLNDLVDVGRELTAILPVHFVLVTGPFAPHSFYIDLTQRVRNLPFTILKTVVDQPSYMAASDIAICRAGYNSLSEAMVAGVPTIAVPHSRAIVTDQHRTARELERIGAVVALMEGNHNLLYQHIHELISSPGKRSYMSSQARQYAKAQQGLEKSAEAIAALLE